MEFCVFTQPFADALAIITKMMWRDNDDLCTPSCFTKDQWVEEMLIKTSPPDAMKGIYKTLLEMIYDEDERIGTAGLG